MAQHTRLSVWPQGRCLLSQDIKAGYGFLRWRGRVPDHRPVQQQGWTRKRRHKFSFDCLTRRFPGRDPHTGGSGTWELARNANSWAPSQTCNSETPGVGPTGLSTSFLHRGPACRKTVKAAPERGLRAALPTLLAPAGRADKASCAQRR